MELIGAVRQSNLKQVEELLKNGADVNARDENGMTPLILAAKKGNAKMVRLLLEHGADVNAQEDMLGWTPLILAAALGHKEVVKVLLEYHPKLHLKDKNGMTPLKYATKNGYDDIASLLKEAGAVK